MAMGSPLGPLFANIFMSFHERSSFYNCPFLCKPFLYQRYVDDCFLLFRSLDHVPLFLNYLERQNPNISFTSELEKDGIAEETTNKMVKHMGRDSIQVHYYKNLSMFEIDLYYVNPTLTFLKSTFRF